MFYRYVYERRSDQIIFVQEYFEDLLTEIQSKMENCKSKKHKTPAELAYDACVYFTDDFSLYNAETGK